MRFLFLSSSLFAITACGGPSQSQIIETPSAQSRPNPGEAPPASTSDKDRERLIQQFDDMETTQRAREEAGARKAPPPPLPAEGSSAPAPNPVGPATPAPPPPKPPKKK